MFSECFHTSIVSAELESALTCTAVSQESQQQTLFSGVFEALLCPVPEKSLAHD